MTDYGDGLRHWADCHNTSIEVAEAIFNMADHGDNVELIWQDPTPEEYDEIFREAFAAAPMERVLRWGDTKIHRDNP